MLDLADQRGQGPGRGARSGAGLAGPLGRVPPGQVLWAVVRVSDAQRRALGAQGAAALKHVTAVTGALGATGGV